MSGFRRYGRPSTGNGAEQASEAAAALELAGGVCSHCGHRGPLIAEFYDHREARKRTGWVAACVDRAGCDRRLLQQLAEEGF